MPANPPSPDALARARESLRCLSHDMCSEIGPCRLHRVVARIADAHAAEQAAHVERLRGALDVFIKASLSIAPTFKTKRDRDAWCDARDKAVAAIASDPAALRARAGADVQTALSAAAEKVRPLVERELRGERLPLSEAEQAIRRRYTGDVEGMDRALEVLRGAEMIEEEVLPFLRAARDDMRHSSQPECHGCPKCWVSQSIDKLAALVEARPEDPRMTKIVDIIADSPVARRQDAERVEAFARAMHWDCDAEEGDDARPWAEIADVHREHHRERARGFLQALDEAQP